MPSYSAKVFAVYIASWALRGGVAGARTLAPAPLITAGRPQPQRSAGCPATDRGPVPLPNVTTMMQPVAQSLMCPAVRDGALCEPGYPKSALVTTVRSTVP